MNKELIYPDESNKLVELAFLLYKEIGRGFKEKVYQDAFEVLLKENGIPYEREKNLKITYHGVVLQHEFFYDFLCYDKIGVEIKALNEIDGESISQLINYLHVGNQQLGLLLNFGSNELKFQFIPNKNNYKQYKYNH